MNISCAKKEEEHIYYINQYSKTSPLNSCIHLHQIFSKRKKAAWKGIRGTVEILWIRRTPSLSTVKKASSIPLMAVWQEVIWHTPFPFLQFSWIKEIHIMCSFVKCRGAVNWFCHLWTSHRCSSLHQSGSRIWIIFTMLCCREHVCSNYCKKLWYTLLMLDMCAAMNKLHCCERCCGVVLPEAQLNSLLFRWHGIICCRQNVQRSLWKYLT